MGGGAVRALQVGGPRFGDASKSLCTRLCTPELTAYQWSVYLSAVDLYKQNTGLSIMVSFFNSTIAEISEIRQKSEK
jgi:hypothetical protein